MSNTEDTKDELLPEYHFDYSKAKPNRFATQQLPVTVTLDADVAKVFTNAEAVNNALRAILAAFPNPQQLHEIK
jgi:hypothetical protein